MNESNQGTTELVYVSPTNAPSLSVLRMLSHTRLPSIKEAEVSDDFEDIKSIQIENELDNNSKYYTNI